jgi:hypothetical protein
MLEVIRDQGLTAIRQEWISHDGVVVIARRTVPQITTSDATIDVEPHQPRGVALPPLSPLSCLGGRQFLMALNRMHPDSEAEPHVRM